LFDHAIYKNITNYKTMSINNNHGWGGFNNNRRRVFFQMPNPRPDEYVPQPHNCYHQIEKDRMHVQNRRLVDDLHRTQVENQELRHTLLAEQLKSVIGRRRRKPRNRCSNKRKHEELVEKQINVEYVPLPLDEVEDVLKDVFSKLYKLDDIIALGEHPHRICLEKNNKFAKLIKIISPVKELQALVGLKNIKSKAFDIIAHYSHPKLSKKDDLKHMIVAGPPGVGKTEVGRLLGKVILGLGILKNDKFVCASRSDLIGQYLGQTAPLTQEVIDSAMGGVLFIDEAYALGHAEKRDSFSKECLDTLNQNLTEKAGEFLCIIAGYEEDLKQCFFGVNKGLQRRFQEALTIKGYDAEELHKIFCGKVTKDQWKLETPEVGLGIFKAKLKYFHYFAGDAESLFQQAKFVAAGRFLRDTTDTVPVLTEKDVQNAYKQCFEKREECSEEDHLSMYN
jgi:DNA polymerase III delta prime subunit